jgi:hypothetical protein
MTAKLGTSLQLGMVNLICLVGVSAKRRQSQRGASAQAEAAPRSNRHTSNYRKVEGSH